MKASLHKALKFRYFPIFPGSIRNHKNGIGGQLSQNCPQNQLGCLTAPVAKRIKRMLVFGFIPLLS